MPKEVTLFFRLEFREEEIRGVTLKKPTSKQSRRAQLCMNRVQCRGPSGLSACGQQ